MSGFALVEEGEEGCLFCANAGNNFDMPQVQLPIFPAGVTHINSEVAFEERDGKVYYFNGLLPVFVHEKSALATFRLFSTQLVINGNATQDGDLSCLSGFSGVIGKKARNALKTWFSGKRST